MPSADTRVAARVERRAARVVLHLPANEPAAETRAVRVLEALCGRRARRDGELAAGRAVADRVVGRHVHAGVRRRWVRGGALRLVLLGRVEVGLELREAGVAGR